MLIGVLLDCTDDFLMMCTLAVGTALGPAKLPDVWASLATNPLHKSTLHFPLLLAVAEHSNLHVSRVGLG